MVDKTTVSTPASLLWYFSIWDKMAQITMLKIIEYVFPSLKENYNDIGFLFANEAGHKSTLSWTVFDIYGPGKRRRSARQTMALPKDQHTSQWTEESFRTKGSHDHFFNGNWSVLLHYKSVMPPGQEVFDHLYPQWGLLCATGWFAITRALYGTTVAILYKAPGFSSSLSYDDEAEWGWVPLAANERR